MIKTLGAYVKEFKRASIATPCYMILEVLMEMMIPYLMASIIDDGVNKGDMKHICVVGAGMLVIAAIGLFAGYSPFSTQPPINSQRILRKYSCLV